MVEGKTAGGSTKSVEGGSTKSVEGAQPHGVEGKHQKPQPNSLRHPQPPSVEQRKLNHLPTVGRAGYVRPCLLFPCVGAISRSERAWIVKHAPAVATQPLPPPLPRSLRSLAAAALAGARLPRRHDRCLHELPTMQLPLGPDTHADTPRVAQVGYVTRGCRAEKAEKRSARTLPGTLREPFPKAFANPSRYLSTRENTPKRVRHNGTEVSAQ